MERSAKEREEIMRRALLIIRSIAWRHTFPVERLAAAGRFADAALRLVENGGKR